MRKAWLVTFCALLAFPSFGAQRDSASEVRATMSVFLAAFDNLDRDRFASFFSPEATMFQPRKFVRRAENKSEIEGQFREIFEVIRGDQKAPPYMHIQPLDLRIQMLGSDVALATFHLDDRPAMLNRRTIVWQKTRAGWKIVHIHASELPVSK